MNSERLLKVVIRPHISEKGTTIAEQNRQFAFKVLVDATKLEIKKAVEMIFKVEVDAVRVTKVQPKIKRFGQRQGKRKGWKKAYVSLKEGHDINFAGSESGL